MNFKKINILLTQKGLAKKEFAESVGLTAAGLRNLINGSGQPRKENLEKICKALEVSESYFYDDGPSMVNEPGATYMKETIEAQRETIRSQAATIEMLQKEIKRLCPTNCPDKKNTINYSSLTKRKAIK